MLVLISKSVNYVYCNVFYLKWAVKTFYSQINDLKGRTADLQLTFEFFRMAGLLIGEGCEIEHYSG